MQWLPNYAITTEHVYRLQEDKTLYLLPIAAANASHAMNYKVVRLDEDNLMFVFLVLRQVRAVDSIGERVPVFERVGYASHDKKMSQIDGVKEQAFKMI